MLVADYHGDETTSIVEEMGLWSGSVRIDIAVINGKLSGFELKSDKDNLNRLPLQAEIYSKVFDAVTLVVGSKHAAQAWKHIPEWWGVMVATQSGSVVSLEPIREAKKNPSPDPYLVAQLLWKDEAIAVLDAHGSADGWRSKRVRAIHERLAHELPFEELAASVRVALKQRDQWLRQVMPSNLNVPIDAKLNPVF
jgi:hypothetical protein